MQEERALSVTDALALAKRTLESITLTVTGEVCEVNCKSGYKAVYFSVKDESSVLPCMMWLNRYSRQSVKLELGQLVELRGNFSLYAAKGRMSFDVTSITLAGEGQLRARVAQLAKKLEALGLTCQEVKKPLPQYPESIGVVTSPRGAAVHDVLRTLRRRWPLAKVYFSGVPVEGTNAAQGIANALEYTASKAPDVILLVRGGGSYEDLMPFNDENLALCIAKLTIPVVTGIGHEPDTTIADLVADVRASTPTAAAETVSPDAITLDALFTKNGVKISKWLSSRLDASARNLVSYTSRPLFMQPEYLLMHKNFQLDSCAERLSLALPNLVSKDTHHLSAQAKTISTLLPRLLETHASACEMYATRANNAQEKILSASNLSLAKSAAQLDALSPLSVLSRGYGIVYNKSGNAVSNACEISAGDEIKTLMHDGEVISLVKEITCSKNSETE